jgi:flagellar export protein FliJ
MTFRFRLDAVLRFRESVEHTEEAALHRIVQEVAEVELEIHRVNLKMIGLREQRERDLTRTIPAVHLMEIAERELELRKLNDGLHSRLQQLESQRLRQLAIYQTARQNREVLKELREQQRHAYQLEQGRREQKALDDLFLTRRRPRD